MPSCFIGTLSGTGIQSLSPNPVAPTDCDINYVTLGPSVRAQGPTGHRVLKYGGWIQFINVAFFAGEAICEPLYLNSESDDMVVPNPLGAQADAFAYFFSPGTSVSINVSY